jgi:hypothetical protein
MQFVFTIKSRTLNKNINCVRMIKVILKVRSTQCNRMLQYCIINGKKTNRVPHVGVQIILHGHVVLY